MATVKHNRGPHHLSQRGAASDLASCLGGGALLSEGAPASPLLAGGVAGMAPTVAQVRTATGGVPGQLGAQAWLGGCLQELSVQLAITQCPLAVLRRVWRSMVWQSMVWRAPPPLPWMSSRRGWTMRWTRWRCAKVQGGAGAGVRAGAAPGCSEVKRQLRQACRQQLSLDSAVLCPQVGDP